MPLLIINHFASAQASGSALPFQGLKVSGQMTTVPSLFTCVMGEKGSGINVVIFFHSKVGHAWY